MSRNKEDKAVAGRDRRVLELTDRLMEIEQRLIPTGLHIFGREPARAVSSDALRVLASFDRPEEEITSLPQLIAAGLGLGSYAMLRGEALSEENLATRERIDRLARDVIETFFDHRNAQPSLRCVEMLNEGGCAIDRHQLEKLLDFLSSTIAGMESSREADSLAAALRGQYVEPGPGGDIIQNPGVLPTGRNTHAVNPYSVPSRAAVLRAEPQARALLDRHRSESGRYPETIAMVLWGIDNIKTQGESVAQALWLLGVRPKRDALNRTTGIEIVPLEQLGRPRIDVVMTVSGIFRDLFGTTMELLDAAVRSVAGLHESDEQNFVRKHVRAQMSQAGDDFDEAVLRVFSNAPGNYGTNVNFMVNDSQWNDSRELGELFVTRKCFAYGRDSRRKSFEGREAKALLERALARVEVTYQNIDSTEVGIVDVDHYFEYLGGVTRAAEKQSGARPAIYLSDSLSPDRKVRTLEETVKLETRTKTLNPKWFEGMLQHGFSGVAEIEHRVTNTFGWSATADAVDDWVYDEVAATFVLDHEMLERLRRLNPHSARTLVGRLLEAAGRGYWSVEPSTLEELRRAYHDLEDRLEGVVVDA
ncbi:MAG TPA: cobaltochelatase subunit CobN [Blastocatellia bacterium]|nr:cobaltochelatase subunit CobN [Blastocatellia bacterium]